MDRIVNIRNAKANLSSLIADVEAGEEIVIARAGKPAVRLMAINSKQQTLPDRRPGFLKGKIRIRSDFDAPLSSDILAAFEGARD